MTTIATIHKNSREEIRVTVEDFKGHTLTNLRVWFEAEGEMRPGKQGLAFRADILPEVIEALISALALTKGGAQ